CFLTEKNKGLLYSRIDVIGVKDVGGDLSGEIETISVEVKKGSQPFATACGQALGYKVYANRVYLAVVRDYPFDIDEISIAGDLGIGLIQIKDDTCREILTSPYYKPITKLNYLLLHKLALGKCTLCGSFFQTGEIGNRYYNLSRNVRKAVKDEKGLLFWNFELGKRKSKMGIRTSEVWDTAEQRFICAECVQYLSQFKI
ncbi:MAG: hypothetical protein AB1546_00500, partial [bacterium]